MKKLNYSELESWWYTAPGARRFIDVISKTVDSNSAIALHLPKEAENGFIQIITEKVQSEHIFLIVETFSYKGGDDVEEFVEELSTKYAPRFLRDFTNDSPLEDLAKQKVLSGYTIIVKLQSKVTWVTSAIADFNKNNSANCGALIFISTETNPAPSLTRLSDFLTPYDFQFFAINLLENARLNVQEKLYTSTLAAKLSKQSALMVKNLAKTELYTYGLDFVKTITPNFDEKFFNRAVWECQTQFLLPALEQIRNQLIEKNFLQLKKILPVTDEFGKTLDEPWDMELRHLHYYGGSAQIFQFNDWEILELAYFARNDLSHLKTLELPLLEKILNIVNA